MTTRTWFGPFALVSVLVAATVGFGCVGQKVKPRKPRTAETFWPPPTGETLRALAEKRALLVGAALSPSHFADARYAKVATEQFNVLTPENEMKWQATEPAQGRFDFRAGDELVKLAEAHGMKVRGHALVWYQGAPAWTASLSADELRAAMLNHIHELATHYRDKVYAWDVVNEAIEDGSSGAVRRQGLLAKLGPQYIEEAFIAARKADPKVLLFYNDYETEISGWPKTEAVYRLVKGLKEKGVPLDGVGFQAHWDPRKNVDTAKFKATLERFAALGVQVNISELDVPVGGMRGELAARLETQAQLYEDIARACIETKGCASLTMWGYTDKYTWLDMREFAHYRGKAPHYPLLLDSKYGAKPAFDGLRRALR